MIPLLQLTISLGEPLFSPESGESLLLVLFKILFVLASFLYVLFSFVVIRQISLMRKTLITPFSPVLSILGWLHSVIAIIVLLIFIIIL